MQFQGIDTAARIGADAARKLKAAGFAFVGRYLVPETYAKALTAAEARDLLGAGLAILPIWETAANRARAGAAAGASDGARAAELAQKLGVPAGTVLYFAVDYLPLPEEHDAIEAYFRAACIAAGPYACGLYGPCGVAEETAARIPGLRIWQCVGWSGGRVSAHADVYQYQWQGGAEAKALAARLGFAVDVDRSRTLAGMWSAAESGGEALSVSCADSSPCGGAKSGEGAASSADPLASPTGRGGTGNARDGEGSAPSNAGASSAPWYAGAMDWAAARGYLRDGRPEDPVTRAELATVLYRVLGEEATG